MILPIYDRAAKCRLVDIARRIAHEIKNPLTPIQLSAERLQARYGESTDDQDVFRHALRP